MPGGEKNKEIRYRAPSDKKQESLQNPDSIQGQNFLSDVIKDISSLKKELLQGKSPIKSPSDKKPDIVSDRHANESSELQAVVSEMDKQYQEIASSTVNRSSSVLFQIGEDIKKELPSLLPLYQEYPDQILSLVQKFGKSRVIGLLRDIVSAGLDSKKPADRGRIASIFSLCSSIPSFIGRLLF